MISVLDITESRVELRTDLSTVDVDSERLRSICTRTLTRNRRSAIIRSSIFLKDKYFASGAFERFLRIYTTCMDRSEAIHSVAR